VYVHTFDDTFRNPAGASDRIDFAMTEFRPGTSLARQEIPRLLMVSGYDLLAIGGR